MGRDRGGRGRQPLSDPGGGHSPAGLLAVGSDVGNMTLHVRTDGAASGAARGLQDILTGVDSRVPVRARPLSSVMAVALFPAKAAAMVLAALGVVGWALTIAGLYGWSRTR